MGLPSAPRKKQSDTGLVHGLCQRGAGPAATYRGLAAAQHCRVQGRTAAKGPGGRVSQTRNARAHASGSPVGISPERGRRNPSHRRADLFSARGGWEGQLLPATARRIGGGTPDPRGQAVMATQSAGCPKMECGLKCGPPGGAVRAGTQAWEAEFESAFLTPAPPPIGPQRYLARGPARALAIHFLQSRSQDRTCSKGWTAASNTGQGEDTRSLWPPRTLRLLSTQRSALLPWSSWARFSLALVTQTRSC